MNVELNMPVEESTEALAEVKAETTTEVVNEGHVDVPGHKEYVKSLTELLPDDKTPVFTVRVDKKGYKQLKQCIKEVSVAYAKNQAPEIVLAGVTRLLQKLWFGGVRATGKDNEALQKLFRALAEEFMVPGNFLSMQSLVRDADHIDTIISLKSMGRNIVVRASKA